MISATHDLRADAAYVTLGEGSVARTVELDNGTLADVDANGRPLGLEVIHPHRRWPLDQFMQTFDVSDRDARTLRAIAESFRGPTPSFGRARKASSSGAILAPRFRPVSA